MDKLRANCIGINYIYKNQQAYFDIGIVDTKGFINDNQERLLKFHGVLPICPNKPSVFIKFRPACPWA